MTCQSRQVGFSQECQQDQLQLLTFTANSAVAEHRGNCLPHLALVLIIGSTINVAVAQPEQGGV